MRTLVTLLSMSLLAPSAFADTGRPARAPRPVAVKATPTVTLAPIDPTTIPEACTAIAKRAAMPNLTQALTARMSLASCLADAKLATLPLCDCNESVAQISEAVAPSLTLLDEVATVGDPAMQAIAQHAKAELLQSISVRMLATVPSAVQATSESLALREARKQIVEAMIRPWRDQATEAHQRVVEIATAHPELATNPVVSTIVRDSRARLASPVATR